MRRLAPLIYLAPGLLSAALGCPKPPPSEPATKDAARPAPAAARSAAWFAPDDPKWQEIDRLEDLRSAGDGKLAALARDERPEVRARALLALGRLRDPAQIPELRAGLSDREPDVRRAAAFASSLLADKATDELRGALRAALLTEAEGFVRDELLLALGRVGKADALEALIGALAEPKTRAAAALGIGLYAQRGEAVPDAAVPALEPLLTSEDAAARYAGVYALMRAKKLSARLLPLAEKDPDAELRATAARALGAAFPAPAKAGDPPRPSPAISEADAQAALARLARDADWRVRVEALRSLARRGALGAPEVDAALRELFSKLPPADGLSGPALHPLLAGLEALQGAQVPREALASLPGVAEIHKTLGAALPGLPEAALLGADTLHCAAALTLDLAAASPDRVKACGSGKTNPWRREVYTVQVLKAKKTPKDAVAGLVALTKSPEARVRAEVFDALGALPGPEVLKALRAGLDDPDLAASSNAVGALVARAKEKEIDREAAPKLVALLYRFTTPADAESIAAVYEALSLVADPKDLQVYGAILAGERDENAAVRDAAKKAKAALYAGGTPPAKVDPKGLTQSPKKGPEPGDKVPLPKGSARARVETSKGAFTFSLLVEAAPRTTANFAALARSGYFDGLTFHRVVPAFVIQGGDPRGDGWGGPGYAIRDELSWERYDRGAVGMALGGPDTGGSQWFVMHQRHPHLESRYAVFGRVTEGLDVIDAIQVGDKILKVTILE